MTGVLFWMEWAENALLRTSEQVPCEEREWATGRSRGGMLQVDEAVSAKGLRRAKAWLFLRNSSEVEREDKE